MDAAETGSSLGQARWSHRDSARPPLPLWAPPVCAVMFGAAVVLQAPDDGMPGLTASLISLVLALGAYALIAGIRARQGTRRRVSPWAQAAAVAGAVALSTSSLNSTGTSGLRWFHVALGVVVAGVVRYRLRRNAP
ncbi:hypothetical protein [Streptomyces sp. 150FB]|uniref:hypothetical protein n=1 Tax=Streptomyces sp. 150FB TaxID=1576605 RepID=UPI001237406B|nr:hypothetical protein [Streptomyces sp. 150FB]